MKRWIIKTAIQRVLSWLPQSHRWNALFQRFVSNGLELKFSAFETKVSCARKHYENYLTYSGKAEADKIP